MQNLAKDYNRRYYRSLILIKLDFWQDIARLWIASKLTRLAFRISSGFADALRMEYYREYELLSFFRDEEKEPNGQGGASQA